MEIAKRYTDELPRLKKCIKTAYDYYELNYKRFHEFRRFVFATSLTNDDKIKLNALGKPEVEFNILEAYVSRQRGEFSKQEPSIIVMPDDGAKIDNKVLEVVENHLRHIIFDANKNGLEYNTFTDSLTGGFSAFEVYTEYAHSMSMKQVIKVRKVKNPTMCGFDPLATFPHKADGRFCFQIYPMSEEDFTNEYPDVSIKEIDFTRTMDGFNFSYSTQKENVLLVCEFYEKKKKRVKIVELVTGHVMTMDVYKKFLEKWEALGKIAAPPGIVGKPRWTEIEKIVRYKFIENQLLEYAETNFNHLPLVFVDGNSIDIQDTTGSHIKEMTRPYVYQAKGLQKLKNFAGQSIINEIENSIQHKLIIAQESLPDNEEYLKAITNIQLPSNYVYKAFKDNDPNTPIPPPREVVRTPIPAEFSNMFTVSDQMSQSILGSYDAQLGINRNQLSGVAIVEGATQSNAAAMPYVVGYLQALSQVANIIVDLIPKYYVTPRTIPMISKDGKRSYQRINDNSQQDNVDLNYDENALSVKVEAGVNFAIQKSRSLQQIIAMMQASPVFAQFMNAKGLKVLVKNMEIYGADQLEPMAEEFMEEMKQMQAMQQKLQMQQQQNNPMMLRAQNERMKLTAEEKQNQAENMLKAAEISVENRQADIDTIKILSEIKNEQLQAAVMMDKADAEKSRAMIDLAMKSLDMKHKHEHEATKLAHNMIMDHKNAEAEKITNTMENKGATNES